MFKRLSIRYKIGLIAFIGFVGFAIYQTATYKLSVDVRDQLQSILTQDFPILRFANQTQIFFAELDKGYQASLAEADMELLYETDAEAANIRLQLGVIKSQYDLSDSNFDELFNVFDAYVELISAHTAAVINNALSYEETLSGYAQVNLLRERYNELQQQFIDERYRSFEKQLVEIEQDEESLVEFGLILGMSITLLLFLVSIFIGHRLVQTFSNAVVVADQIASGNLEQTVEINSEDETGQLLKSLLAMRDVLRQQAFESQARAREQGFAADLNELMRGEKTVTELTRSILSYLANKLVAQRGAIYVLDGQYLHLVAEYAKPTKASWPEKLKLGETLIGQVALDLQAKIIKDVPSDYVNIEMGMGEGAPSNVLLVPIVFEGQLKAVVELAAFHSFSGEELGLILRSNDAIATAINSAQVRYEVDEMLRKTQEQAQELQLQRQELALFNAQLEEQTADLDRQKNQVIEKNKELEASRKELLEKSEALEQSGQYKSQFLSTMSHELRTPLNSILILSEALMENRKSNLDEKDVQHAKVIHNAGGDLLALINDILDLSKVEEGKMELLIDKISSRDFADTLGQLFEYQASERGLKYGVELASDVPQYFYSDKHRLLQIVKNFISNAIKFTEQGGVFVNISRAQDKHLEKNQASDGEYLLITVKDTGIGIEKDKQELVFEAFKQADGTTSRKYGGTGLGLTISRELARLLNGRIFLESDGLGKGSSFSVLLPIGDECDVTTSKKEVIDNNSLLNVNSYTGQEKILLIEDNPVLIRVVRTVFEQYGVDIAIAETGREALQLVEQQAFDAIIADLNLPDYDGVDLLTQLRTNFYPEGLPLLVFTAEDVLGERKENILRYADSIVSKSPQVIANLPKYIASLLAGSQLDEESLRRALAGRTILLVDDDARNLYSICSILEAEKINVVTAKSGVEALSFLKALPEIELILLDIMMPEMDGYEVLQRLRKQEKSEIPVIALTAKAMVGDKERCLQEGANAYLAKPVKPKLLLETIAQLLIR